MPYTSGNKQYTRDSSSPTGWVSRPIYVKAEMAEKPTWLPVAVDDIPKDVFRQKEARDWRYAHPERPKGGIRRLAHPVVDEAAIELGLTPDEFRQKLNDDSPDGTRKRVSEERFDEIAASIKMSPQEIRNRFAGRHKK